MASVAASSAPLPRRARALLDALRSAVPFDAAWLALSDSVSGTYVPLASVGLGQHVLHFLRGPAFAGDLATTGADRDRPPMSRSDLPYPAERLATWSDCLLPAGIQESLTIALFTPSGRRVGLVALFSKSSCAPARTPRRRLMALAHLLTLGIDTTPCLLATARLVRGATAGRVLRTDGGTEPLPGLRDDPLLAPGSAVVAAARGLGGELPYSSFLWPLGDRYAADGHVRVTVVTAPTDVPAHLAGVALVSPAPHLRDLTPRELEVLGLLVDGCSNHEIARTLVVAPRTVAAHVEHVLVKLDATTRTLAAVRAERAGLYVPSLPQPSGQHAVGGHRAP
ncbi:response regulator transcription factor [Nocardioides anomalus]|uniref:Response regulator transcription factor n=2 Tax=Nocardioides anomalus TaxID=2712223 RepID=A0A6G6WL10_9ACTN|nr:response regulator transcription factor [Nocardioides anomalus]